MFFFLLLFSNYTIFEKLSQSTLQLSGDNNIDNNQPQTSTNHHHHTSFGARYLFGRRRSGEENAKNHLKIVQALSNRTTTTHGIGKFVQC